MLPSRPSDSHGPGQPEATLLFEPDGTIRANDATAARWLVWALSAGRSRPLTLSNVIGDGLADVWRDRASVADAAAWQAAVIADAPDAIFYPELGMDPLTYHLAARRLAALHDSRALPVLHQGIEQGGLLALQAYAALRQCPYRYFADHLLQLGEIDDEALRRAEDFADGFSYE